MKIKLETLNPIRRIEKIILPTGKTFDNLPDKTDEIIQESIKNLPKDLKKGHFIDFKA